MKLLLAIAFGGAVGAVGRHFVAAQVGHWFGSGFPWGILAVNAVGSLLLGILIETMALAWSPGLELRALLTVGVLGAFTTFSTFALDVVLLYERGAFVAALLYVAGSVVLSVGGLLLGLRLARVVLV